MAAHQAVRVDRKPVSLVHLPKQLQKMHVVAPVVEDPPPLDPAVHHVIPAILHIHTQRSRHAANTSRSSARVETNVECSGVTPSLIHISLGPTCGIVIVLPQCGHTTEIPAASPSTTR
jgi:hypothetical protein